MHRQEPYLARFSRHTPPRIRLAYKRAPLRGASGVGANVFDRHLLLVEDVKHSGQEQRFHALGMTSDGRRLHLTFTLRSDDTLIRVISARDMHRKERNIYDKET